MMFIFIKTKINNDIILLQVYNTVINKNQSHKEKIRMIRKTEFKGKTLIFQDLYFNDFCKLLKKNNATFKILNDGKREDGYTDYDACTYYYDEMQKYAYSFMVPGFIDETDEITCISEEKLSHDEVIELIDKYNTDNLKLEVVCKFGFKGFLKCDEATHKSLPLGRLVGHYFVEENEDCCIRYEVKDFERFGNCITGTAYQGEGSYNFRITECNYENDNDKKQYYYVITTKNESRLLDKETFLKIVYNN